MFIRPLNLIISFFIVFAISMPAYASVYLSMTPSSQSISVGSEFTLDMALSNSVPEQLSALNVWLSFDPTYLEVVDSDSGNWITTGINVLDGPYQTNFNWDAHVQNIVDNTNGTISYGEASLYTNVFGSGTFAQINFLAKSVVLNTPITYKVTGTYGFDDTYVTDISADNILGGVSGASVSVIPEPASMLLFGAGLMGMWGRMKRKGKQKFTVKKQQKPLDILMKL